jgi:DNA gyrase subunit B
VKFLNANKETLHAKPVVFQRERDDVAVDVAFQYNDTYAESLLSLRQQHQHARGWYAPRRFPLGAHAHAQRTTPRPRASPRASRPTSAGEDVREGLVAVVSVKMQNPQFERSDQGPSSATARSTGAVETVVGEGLREYFEENPSVVAQDRREDDLGGRALARRPARRAISRAARAILDGGALPGKLADCSFE